MIVKHDALLYHVLMQLMSFVTMFDFIVARSCIFHTFVAYVCCYVVHIYLMCAIDVKTFYIKV